MPHDKKTLLSLLAVIAIGLAISLFGIFRCRGNSLQVTEHGSNSAPMTSRGEAKPSSGLDLVENNAAIGHSDGGKPRYATPSEVRAVELICQSIIDDLVKPWERQHATYLPNSKPRGTRVDVMVPSIPEDLRLKIRARFETDIAKAVGQDRFDSVIYKGLSMLDEAIGNASPVQIYVFDSQSPDRNPVDIHFLSSTSQVELTENGYKIAPPPPPTASQQSKPSYAKSRGDSLSAAQAEKRLSHLFTLTDLPAQE